MRSPARTVLGVVLLVLSAACATTKIKSEGDKKFDYSKWKTFGWLPAKGEIAEGSPFWPDVQRMVTQALAPKGLTPAGSGQPDCMVGFYAGIGVVSDVDWGYIYMPWWTSNPRLLNNDDFSKGVVVLDLMDARTKQLVWRGGARQYVSERVMNKPDEMAAILRGLLPRILEGYPPK
jgi:hypothetical protein